ncbi:MAG: hypothetical protein HF560_10600 [Synechococcus sp. MIT S9220]|uniref:heparinase II/III family protein n=1 Tax=unclassified Synechococcus TaxID=2626047 RepID=UPI00164C9319|nr:heparinase II/III family protein [Synechococcus sp. MIT S9220]NOL48008.1 hypothetical protein [Synechococcus sp. MIT S9220]
MPPYFFTWLATTSNDVEFCTSYLHCLEITNSYGSPCSFQLPKSITFSFLNQSRELFWPIRWNDKHWPRLWQFHLHYFDWAREWLEIALLTSRWPQESSSLALLIDLWIFSNPFGRGDGWHSYTLSLRIRNWVWLFRCVPQLATSIRVQSLWHQLCWLESHPESCYGGNHWLENLLAIAIGSLQFSGSRAEAMHHRSLLLLNQELISQVLPDGGHEERSAVYHLLILDRLVELACVLISIRGSAPDWLRHTIKDMASWVSVVRLEGGILPRFNDSAEDAAPPLDEVLAFAHSYLTGSTLDDSVDSFPRSPLRRKLLSSAIDSVRPSSPISNLQPTYHFGISDLPDTGWTFLRPGYGWELAFKSGVPCPSHLPAHVHSDQLSFELIQNGHFVFSEAGTSVYDNCSQRAFERSGSAHNQLQLGVPNASSGEVDWFEPVEVWGSFRAGRKSQPRLREFGSLPNGGCFVSGAHDGFDPIGATHNRRIEILDVGINCLSLTVIDTVITNNLLHLRQWWHLAPDLHRSYLKDLRFEFSEVGQIQGDWSTTTFAHGFGNRVSRHSFCLHGVLLPGEHCLRVHLPVVSTNPSLSV